MNLQNRLRSLSTGLVGLRNVMPELAAMHQTGGGGGGGGAQPPIPSGALPLGGGGPAASGDPATASSVGGVRSAVAAFETGRLPTYQNHPVPAHTSGE